MWENDVFVSAMETDVAAAQHEAALHNLGLHIPTDPASSTTHSADIHGLGLGLASPHFNEPILNIHESPATADHLSVSCLGIDMPDWLGGVCYSVDSPSFSSLLSLNFCCTCNCCCCASVEVIDPSVVTAVELAKSLAQKALYTLAQIPDTVHCQVVVVVAAAATVTVPVFLFPLNSLLLFIQFLGVLI